MVRFRRGFGWKGLTQRSFSAKTWALPLPVISLRGRLGGWFYWRAAGATGIFPGASPTLPRPPPATRTHPEERVLVGQSETLGIGGRATRDRMTTRPEGPQDWPGTFVSLGPGLPSGSDPGSGGPRKTPAPTFATQGRQCPRKRELVSGGVPRGGTTGSHVEGFSQNPPH